MNRPAHGSHPRRAVLIGTAAALSILAAVPVAQAQLAQRQQAPTDEAVIVRAGQTVSIDPQTGKLRQPTSEEARTLALQMLGQFQRTSAPLVVQQAPDGMLSAQLPEEYQDVTVLRLLPDGSTVIECVQGPDLASNLVLRGDLPTPGSSASGPAPSLTRAPARPAHRTALAPARHKPAKKTSTLRFLSTAGR